MTARTAGVVLLMPLILLAGLLALAGLVALTLARYVSAGVPATLEPAPSLSVARRHATPEPALGVMRQRAA